MQNLIVPTTEIELALCANQEIAATLAHILEAHGAPPRVTAILLARLEADRVALSEMTLSKCTSATCLVPMTSVDAAIARHAEVMQAAIVACELAGVEAELLQGFAASFWEFKIGLDGLAAMPRAAA